MKKLIILFFIIIHLFADNNSIQNIKKEILTTISQLLVKKPNIKIYINSNEFNNLNLYDNNIIKVNSCKKADICFVDKFPNSKNIVFATNYYLYYENKNTAGAFFWQKGRPVILFRKEFLISHSIKLPAQYSEFIE